MVSDSDIRKVTLVAMAPSGEAFLVRDGDGVLRLYGPAQPDRIVDDETTERAILAGFDRVEESFVSWADLGRERQRRAGLLAPTLTSDMDEWDEARVGRALTALEAWVIDGRILPARKVLHRLLKSPAARHSAGALDKIGDLLERSEEREAVRLPLDPPDEYKAAARARMRFAA